MDCSIPGFLVLTYVLEFTQTHVHQWYHPTISCSVAPFSCPQSFPASWSFPMSQLLESGGQRVRASASTSVLPMSIQGLTGLISLHSRDSQDWFDIFAFKGLSRVFSNTTILCSAFFMVQLSHLYMTSGKTIVLTIWNCWQSYDSAFLYTV